MAITRIKNNQITDASAGNIYLGVNAAAKLQDYSITSAKIANDLTYNSSLVITGNLTVQGNTTTIDTTNLVVEDPLIILASEQTGSPALDIGYIGQRGTEDNIAFIWDESADEFATVFTTDLVTNTTITINGYASLHTLNLDVDGNIDIGGNITITGNIAGNLNITGNLAAGNISAVSAIAAGTTITAVGNIDGGNLNTAGEVVATGNVTGGNINTAGQVVATGNVTGGNINTAGQVVATGNITGGNLVTAGQAVVTGNITGGNINTAGQVVATGNVSGGNLISAADVTTVTVTASGNIVGANINTAGQVVATGNITGGNIAAVSAISAGTTIDAVGNITGGNLITAGLTSTNTLSVTGNANVGNLGTTGLITATGNISGGNLISNAAISAATTIDATGNITGGNIITAGLTSTATLSASGNANVGNLGTAGLIVATGNIDGGNINTIGNVTAVTVIASGNVDAGTAVNANLISGTSVQINSTGDIVLNPTGNINVSGVRVRNMSDPQLAFDAATKQYVDDAVSAGIHIHTPVDVETTAALTTVTYANGGNTFTVNETIAGNTVVFTTAANLQVNDQLWFTNSFNGVVGNLAYFVVSTPNASAAVLTTAYNGVPVSNITSGSGLTEAVRVNSGVGATLTATANGAIVVDGVSLSAGNRVMVNDQLNQIENGIYEVTDAGSISTPYILTRSTDADLYIPDSSIGLDQGSYFYVESGDQGAGSSYVKTAPAGPFIFGVGNIEFTQFSSSQVYSANTQAGLSLTGTVFSAKVDNDTTAFDGGGNIIVKTGANLVTPNIGNAVGNSLTLTGNGLITATNLDISANVLAGNVNSNAAVTGITFIATGNITGGNIDTTGQINATGNITGGNIVSNALVTGANVQVTTLTANRVVYVGADDYLVDSANFTFDGANANLQGQMIIDNFTIDGTSINSNANISVVSSANGNIDITPDGTGVVNINNIAIADNTISSTTGNIVLDPAANIVLPDETASAVLYLTADREIETSSNFTYDGTQANITGNLNVQGVTVLDNFTVDGTSITSNANLTITSSSNGNVDVTPNGTGVVNIDNITIADNTIGSSTGNIIIDPSGTINLPDEISNAILYTGSANQVSTDANLTYDGTDVQLLNGNIKVGDAVANVFVTNEGIQGTNRLVINQDSSDVDFAVNGDTTANIFYIDAGTETASFGNATQTTNALVAFNSSTSILVPVGNSAQRPAVGVTGMVRFNTTTDVLEFYDADSWVSAGSVFTVIDSEVFNGDGSTLVFTLGSDQTTDSCIVSINGIVQIPITAYAVAGNVLTFTEAPLSQDVIEVRQITTTVTVKSLSNTPGNAIIELSDTSNDITITGDLIPSANVTFDLGSASLRWKDGYFAGNSITLGNIVLKNTTGNTLAFFGPDGTTPGVLSSNNVDTTSIANGTAAVQTFNNANVAISAGGTSNVALFQSTGLSITGDLSVTGNATLSGNILGDRIQNGTTQIDIQTQNGNANITVAGTSNVAVFSSSGVEIKGNITNGGSNGAGNIGSATTYFNTIFAKATSAQYADLAEMYEADAEYKPGTVLCFGGTKEVTLCARADSTRVAGVVSTNPSYLMNSGQSGEYVAAVALTGRVPCRVTGTIRKGDLIVSTGDGRGCANNSARVGTVIGKALADFEGTDGMIEVVVGRV
jgi:hypothetical protein